MMYPTIYVFWGPEQKAEVPDIEDLIVSIQVTLAEFLGLEFSRSDNIEVEEQSDGDTFCIIEMVSPVGMDVVKRVNRYSYEHHEEMFMLDVIGTESLFISFRDEDGKYLDIDRDLL